MCEVPVFFFYHTDIEAYVIVISSKFPWLSCCHFWFTKTWTRILWFEKPCGDCLSWQSHMTEHWEQWSMEDVSSEYFKPPLSECFDTLYPSLETIPWYPSNSKEYNLILLLISNHVDHKMQQKCACWLTTTNFCFWKATNYISIHI